MSDKKKVKQVENPHDALDQSIIDEINAFISKIGMNNDNIIDLLNNNDMDKLTLIFDKLGIFTACNLYPVVERIRPDLIPLLVAGKRHVKIFTFVKKALNEFCKREIQIDESAGTCQMVITEPPIDPKLMLLCTAVSVYASVKLSELPDDIGVIQFMISRPVPFVIEKTSKIICSINMIDPNNAELQILDGTTDAKVFIPVPAYRELEEYSEDGTPLGKTGVIGSDGKSVRILPATNVMLDPTIKMTFALPAEDADLGLHKRRKHSSILAAFVRLISRYFTKDDGLNLRYSLKQMKGGLLFETFPSNKTEKIECNICNNTATLKCCESGLYCSSECRQIDWITHQDKH